VDGPDVRFGKGTSRDASDTSSLLYIPFFVIIYLTRRKLRDRMMEWTYLDSFLHLVKIGLLS